MPSTQRAFVPAAAERAYPPGLEPPLVPGSPVWKVVYTSLSEYSIEHAGVEVEAIVVPQEATATILVLAPPETYFVEPYLHWEDDRHPFKLAVSRLVPTVVEIVETNENPRLRSKAFCFQPVLESFPLQPFLGGDPTIFNEGTGGRVR